MLYLIRDCIRLKFSTMHFVTDIASHIISQFLLSLNKNPENSVRNCRSPLATSFRVKVTRRFTFSRREQARVQVKR